MIAIIDYGMGNLRSVQKAFEHVGAKAVIVQNSRDIEQANKIVLPGVGAIQPAIAKLTELGLTDPIKKAISTKKPFLGICLGYQLLFESSDEGGNHQGLGLIDGTVKKFDSLKIPHMGWNQIKITKNNCPLFLGIKDNANVYFCHSYYVQPDNTKLVATHTEYGRTFASSIWQENLFGVQFHPEKSQKIGLRILKNFSELSL